MLDPEKNNAEGHARDPGRIADLLAGIVDGSRSSAELVQSYLDRIAQADASVEAWSELDADRALADARQRDEEAAQGKIRGQLHGIPVGVKDIIDVEGLPTRCGSKSRAAAPAAGADAEVISALRTQGAVVLGKLHTTEFAFRDASPARNPWEPRPHAWWIIKRFRCGCSGRHGASRAGDADVGFRKPAGGVLWYCRFQTEQPCDVILRRRTVGTVLRHGRLLRRPRRRCGTCF